MNNLDKEVFDMEQRRSRLKKHAAAQLLNGDIQEATRSAGFVHDMEVELAQMRANRFQARCARPTIAEQPQCVC